MEAEQLLLDFLATPLDSGDALFERLSELPGAICGRGDKPHERFVYIPGTRKDRVVLTAHADTVWDAAYQTPHIGAPSLQLENGRIFGTDPDCGIGADDRAGCAMLWALKDSGHSLLLLDGEEHGKTGANYLKKEHPKLFREIDRHRFILALDWIGTNCCLYNQVNDTKRFQRKIEKELGFVDSQKKGGSDLQILCYTVCGVNLGVGYHRYHKENEFICVAEWENTLNALTSFLQKPQKRYTQKLSFRIKRCFLRWRHFFGAPVKKLLRRS